MIEIAYQARKRRIHSRIFLPVPHLKFYLALEAFWLSRYAKIIQIYLHKLLTHLESNKDSL